MLGKAGILRLREVIGTGLAIFAVILFAPLLVWLLTADKRKVGWLHIKFKLWNAWWYCRRLFVRQSLSPCNFALRQAALNGEVHNVEMLLQRGADANLLVNYDWPLLARVAEYGYTEIVWLLLDAGAQIDAKSPSTHQTALMMAANNGHVGIVALLLQHGADIDAANIAGTTSLLSATMARQTEVVRLLSKVYREHRTVPKQGLEALSVAQKRGYAEIIERLNEAGIKDEITLLRPSSSPCAPAKLPFQ